MNNSDNIDQCGTERAEPPPLGGEAPGRIETRGRKVSPDRNWFNQALHRIVRGNLGIGDVCAQLSVLTGIPYFDIRKRINDVEYTYSDNEKMGSDNELSSADLKTIIGRYNRSKDPAVQEWLAMIRRPEKLTRRAKEVKAIDSILNYKSC